MYRRIKMYKVDLTIYPAICLPINVDETDLIDITTMGDSFRSYLNPKTNRVYDGAKYYSEYLDR